MFCGTILRSTLKISWSLECSPTEKGHKESKIYQFVRMEFGRLFHSPSKNSSLCRPAGVCRDLNSRFTSARRRFVRVGARPTSGYDRSAAKDLTASGLQVSPM